MKGAVGHGPSKGAIGHGPLKGPWGGRVGTPKIRNSAGRRSRHIGALRADLCGKSRQSLRVCTDQRILNRFGAGRGRNHHGGVGKVRFSMILGPWENPPFQGWPFLKIGPPKRGCVGRRSRHIGLLRPNPWAKPCQSPRVSVDAEVLSRFGAVRGRFHHEGSGKVRFSGISGPSKIQDFGPWPPAYKLGPKGDPNKRARAKTYIC